MFGGERDGPPPTMAPRGRQKAVMVGLLFTFIGLVALIEVIPLEPPQFPNDVAALAVGIVGVFIGGILLGYGVGARRPRSR
jgi:hypothetical protein